MGLLDTLLKNKDLLGSVAGMAAKNPQLLQAAASLLSSKDTSVGGSGGLGGLVSALSSSGMEDIVSSWVGGGENKAISADQISSALGSDALSQFSQKAGIDVGDAGSMLAGLLPSLVNQLTPDGQMPDSGGIEAGLAALFS